MAGVQKHEFQILDVALEGLGARLDKDLVILAPNGQYRDFAGSQVGLEVRVELHVGLVVLEQAQLDVDLTGALQEGVVELVRLGRDLRQQLLVADAVRVLEFGRGEAEQAGFEHVALAGRVRFPERADRVPERTEPFYVRVSVLGDDGCDGLWALQSNAECDRGAVVKYVYGKRGDQECVEKFERRVGEACKCVVVIGVRDSREAKSREVGRDHMVGLG